MNGAMPRFIFTVSTGRSGQASLTGFFERFVPDCLALFEEPQINPILPGPAGNLERRFRRRFIETHELLGRGRVLTAFDDGDEVALEQMAQARVDWMLRQAARHKAALVADISKHFVHGLHRHTIRILGDATLIRLVRDPIQNMRSYLNRSKNFYLDNNSPGSRFNQLTLDPEDLGAGELYLWSWCETYLRGDALAAEFDLTRVVEIRTEDMNNAETMARHFSALGIPHNRIEALPPRNTNIASGFGSTAVSVEDIETFERFIGRIPSATLERMHFLTSYDPRERHLIAAHSA
jgi:hypothetical protein